MLIVGTIRGGSARAKKIGKGGGRVSKSKNFEQTYVLNSS